MNVKTLIDIGLNETQAKAYILLIKNGSVTPRELTSKLTITRTNAYAVLDQLVDMELAIRRDVQKKLTYYAGHPTALERLARARRSEALEHEKQIQASMPALLNFFHSFSDQPGVKFYQGVDGIKEIYEDILRTRQDIHVFRSAYDQDLMSTEFFLKFKARKAKLGITSYMINPANNPEFWNETFDKQQRLVRTPISLKEYDANTEISTYGDKVSIISFGDEAIGMIIISPQIAKAMRQIYALACSGSGQRRYNRRKA